MNRRALFWGQTNETVSEQDFEAAIEVWLVDHAGYEKADNSQFDATSTLDSSYGGNIEKSLVHHIAAKCGSRGLLDVMRNRVRNRHLESAKWLFSIKRWCPGTESNCRHEDFQSTALPTELPGHQGTRIKQICGFGVKIQRPICR